MPKIESLPDPNSVNSANLSRFPIQSYGRAAVSSVASAENIQQTTEVNRLESEALLTNWQLNLEAAGYSLPDLSISELPDFSKAAHAYIHGYFHGLYTSAQSKGKKEPAAVPYKFMDNRLTSFYAEHLSAIGSTDSSKVERLGKVREDNTKLAFNYQTIFPEIAATKSFADKLIASKYKVAANAMYNLLTVYGMTADEIRKIVERQAVKQKVTERETLRRPFK